MNPTLKNVLAVVGGLVVGSAVNMGIIMVSGKIIPPPAGVDTSTMEGLKAGMSLFEPKHFLLPFLAHALGTLVGAWVAARFCASSHLAMAMVVGGLFLIGGIMNVMMLQGPMWFNATDILLAYLPMAFLGHRLAKR